MKPVSAPRYDLPRHWTAPDASVLAHNAVIFEAQREWCAKKNGGAHRKRPGTSTCIDCGQDLDL